MLNNPKRPVSLTLDIECGGCHHQLKRSEKKFMYKDVHYHLECFKCSQCNQSLVEKPFYPRADNQFLCEQCNEQVTPVCVRCGQKIPSGVRARCYKAQRYHSKCFTCQKCGAMIPDNMNFVDCLDGNFQCLNCSHHMTMGHTGREHAPDVENVFGAVVEISPDQTGRVPLCDKCESPVKAGEPGYNHIDRYYHISCATCNRCRRKVINIPCRKLGSALVCHTCS